MFALGNSATSWGSIAKLFHWIGALLILVLIGHGWWMTEFAPRADRFMHYSWHASIGYALLAMMILRLLWRWANAVPALPLNAAPWEKATANFAHWGLYLLIFSASIAGWALAGTLRRPLDASLLGLMQVPNIVTSQERAVHQQLEGLHSFLAWSLAALVVIHIVGAIYQHYFKKTDILRRMLPGTTDAG